MNETKKTTARLEKILKILEKNPQGLSRSELQKYFKNISKITLVRDINKLLEYKHIKSTGNGRGTKYLYGYQHPLIKRINLKQYFKSPPDQRARVKTFNLDIFPSLNNLLLKSEKTKLDLLNDQYLARTRPIGKTIKQKELERFTIELAWKSSRIEGNTYSLLETEALIRKQQLAKGKTQAEAQMILNHKTTFDTIYSHKPSFKKLTFSNVINIHSQLIDQLEVEKGIRSHPVGITGTNYMPLKNQPQIKLTLKQIVKVINQTKHPVEKALIANAMIAYLQPFADGNKRTGRLTGNAILLAHNYVPLSYRSVNEMEYKEAIVLFYETNNLYHFKKIFIDQFIFSANTYFI